VNLRIATFNVNGVNGRLQNLLTWLERESPDIACLQELKAADSAFPEAAIRAAGYQALWQGERSWNGVAILSKNLALVDRRRGLPLPRTDVQCRYIEAEAAGIVVASLYLPNGNPQPGPKFDYKLEWFERLNRHARALLRSGKPAVLAGDFNVVPTDFDIYDPKSWRRDALLQPESRDAYARLLAQGWTDALRELHPQERIYTFWDYFRNHWQRDAGLRIDHLLISPALAPRLAAAGVDRWVRGEPKPSDHAPAWIELEVAVRRSRRVSRAAPSAARRRNATRTKKRSRPSRRRAATPSPRTSRRPTPRTTPARRAPPCPSRRAATARPCRARTPRTS
jgi:exodeoxyribonuclease-3